MTDIPDWVSKPPLTPTKSLRHFGYALGDPSSILAGPVHYDAHAHYARVKPLWDAYPFKDEDACREHAIHILERAFVRRKSPSEAVCQALWEAIIEILVNEDFYLRGLEPPHYPDDPAWRDLNLKRFFEEEQFYATYRERLTAMEDAFVRIFSTLADALPEAAYSEDAPAENFPLINSIPSPKELIHAIHYAFTFQKHNDKWLFPKTFSLMWKNLCALSKQTLENVKPERLIFPDRFDGTPAEAVELYFHDTPLHKLLMTPLPFSIPDETRFAGHWIIAPPGRGKTTLLHSMIMEDLKKDAALVIMDSKGDLINPIRELAFLADRLVIIDPDKPISLNPLDVPKVNVRRVVSRLEYIFSALLEAKITPKQQSLFRSVLRALIIGFEHPTLELFRDIISHGVKKYQNQVRRLPDDLQEFFDKEFDRDYDATRNELTWRLRLLMENDFIRTMLNAPITKFNLGKEMDEGKVIIINNSQALLDKDGAEFFARFFVAQIWAAATARSLQTYKKPVYVYIDECQTVIRKDEMIASIIDECRSQHIALILAHQRVVQIESENVLSALGNCAIRMSNSDEEAKYLAPKLRTEPEHLQSLKRGQFAVFVRDLVTQAVTLDVRPVDFSLYPKLSPAQKTQLTEKMTQAYGYTPETQKLSEEGLRDTKSPAPPREKPQPARPVNTPFPCPQSPQMIPTPATTPNRPQSGAINNFFAAHSAT